jgi:hypothetical protein
MLTKYQVGIYSSDIQCKKILRLQEYMFCNASEVYVLSNNTAGACSSTTSQWRTEGGGLGGSNPPQNTKLQLSPEPLTRGPLPPDPRSLCPLPSAEFVEPPRTKFLSTPLQVP